LSLNESGNTRRLRRSFGKPGGGGHVIAPSNSVG
jgi:hypothetical protein